MAKERIELDDRKYKDLMEGELEAFENKVGSRELKKFKQFCEKNGVTIYRNSFVISVDRLIKDYQKEKGNE